MGDAMSQVPMRLRLVSAYGGWIYTHFEAYRLKYEAMLPWVGVEPNWRVLDAGGGSYLPLLTELV